MKMKTIIQLFLLGTLAWTILLLSGSMARVPDAAAQGGDTYVYLPIVIKPPDVNITGFEVVQSVQDANNGVPVEANRATVVRVFTATTSGNNLANHTMTLTAARNGTPLGSISAGPQTASAASSRSSYGSTFNFILPANWLSGSVTLTATDDVTGAAGSTTINFTSVPTLNVMLVPIRYTHTPNGVTYAAPTQDRVSDWVMRAYPLSNINITFHADYPFTGDLGSGQSWDALLSEVSDLKRAENQPADTLYYAYIPNDWFNGGIAGYGWIGWRASSGIDLPANWGSDAAGKLAGHEWGHNFGRRHAPCGGPAGVDTNWPTDPKYDGASIGEFGMDGILAGAPLLLNPASYVDMMSYCGPEWVSDYTYLALMQDQVTSEASATAAAQESLLISGKVEVDGRITLSPIYTLPQVPNPAPDGAYRIELLDSAGQVMAVYGAEVLEAEEQGVVSRAIHTAVLLPDEPVAAVRIVAAESGAVAAQQTMQLDAALFSTFSGDNSQMAQVDTATNTAVLRWGLPDTPATVRYTADDGQTWTVLALDVLGGELTVDLSTLPGGNGRFQIIPANSGVPARIDVPLSVTLPNNAPTVWITGPSTAVAGSPAALFGHASDREDGALPVTWLVDGKVVSAGDMLLLSDLAVGKHVVKAMAVDDDGVVGEYGRIITITP
jgi:hypothetical protein